MEKLTVIIILLGLFVYWFYMGVSYPYGTLRSSVGDETKTIILALEVVA